MADSPVWLAPAVIDLCVMGQRIYECKAAAAALIAPA